MTTLHLIRHGQTPNNVAGALDTALPGAGLTDLGVQQAQDLVDRLHQMPINAVASSQHLRAQLTATPLAQARRLDIHVDPRFGEIEAGDLEMMTTHESHMEYLHTVFAWSQGDLERRMPGGANGHDTLARYTGGISDLVAAADQDDTIALVSHGAIIRCWVTSQAAGIEPSEVEHRRLLNTAVLTVEGKPGNWRFVGWDDPRLVDAQAADPTAEADD